MNSISSLLSLSLEMGWFLVALSPIPLILSIVRLSALKLSRGPTMSQLISINHQGRQRRTKTVLSPRKFQGSRSSIAGTWDKDQIKYLLHSNLCSLFVCTVIALAPKNRWDRSYSEGLSRQVKSAYCTILSKPCRWELRSTGFVWHWDSLQRSAPNLFSYILYKDTSQKWFNLSLSFSLFYYT